MGQIKNIKLHIVTDIKTAPISTPLLARITGRGVRKTSR